MKFINVYENERDDPPPVFKNDVVVIETVKRYLKSGAEALVTIKKIYSRKPIFKIIGFHEGEHGDPCWEYPLIEEKIIAGPKNAEFTTQGLSRQARKNVKIPN